MAHPQAAASPAQTPTGSGEPTTTRLRAAVIDMESIATTALDEIHAIATLALAYLETPQGYKNPDAVAKALEVVVDRSSVSSDSIAHEAEQVGAHQENPSWLRRVAARLSVREQGASA